MAVNTVKRLASDIMGVGTTRVKFKEGKDSLTRIKEALTRMDVQGLIKDGVVYKVPKKGRRKVKKSKKRGKGSRKGKSIIPAKEKWMTRVRAQRKYLKELVDSNALDKENKRTVYRRIKSGLFRSKKAMLIYLKDAGLIHEEKLKEGEKK